MPCLTHNKRYLALVMVLILVFLAGCGAKGKNAASTSEETTAPVSIFQREGLQTILVACLTDFDVENAAGSFRNGQQADFLMLMVVDSQQSKTTALQLNPDTVVSFNIPGSSDTIALPVGMTYSYGSGGSDSFLGASKTISQLLGGIKIDHYMIFTMDAIMVATDMLGGIEISEDQLLAGQEAAAFFCFRAETDVDNTEHMGRQRQYMTGLYGPFLEKAGSEDFLAQLTLQMGEGMNTDLTLSQMVQMMELLETYEMDETILTLEGTTQEEDGEFRFYPEEEYRKQLVEQLFFD